MTSSVIVLSTIRKITSSGRCSVACLPPVNLRDHICLIVSLGEVYFRPRQSDYFTAR